MAETKLTAPGKAYFGATPITRRDMVEKLDEIMNRAETGETFVVIENAKAVYFMIPHVQYQVLIERDKAAKAAAAGG